MRLGEIYIGFYLFENKSWNLWAADECYKRAVDAGEEQFGGGEDVFVQLVENRWQRTRAILSYAGQRPTEVNPIL